VIPAELQIDNVPAVEYVRGYWVRICFSASLLPGSQLTQELVGVGGIGPLHSFILIDAYKERMCLFLSSDCVARSGACL
jgi:hypothetical protein